VIVSIKMYFGGKDFQWMDKNEERILKLFIFQRWTKVLWAFKKFHCLVNWPF